MDVVTEYLRQIQQVLSALPGDEIWEVVHVLLDGWHDNKQIFLLGNGGSATTASHFANDLNKGTALPGKPRFRAIALVDNVPLIMAWANDNGYENVFVEQMVNFLEAGDIVVGISGSGNSPNVLKAMQAARSARAVTIGFTGRDGGQLKSLVDHCIIVPSDDMKQIEDVHLILEHCICGALRQLISSGK